VSSVHPNLPFDDDTMVLLSRAYLESWYELEAANSPAASLANRNATRRELANRIIELAATGERNVARLRVFALRGISGSH